MSAEMEIWCPPRRKSRCPLTPIRVSACVNNTTKVVRIPTLHYSSALCRPSENQVNWSITARKARPAPPARPDRRATRASMAAMASRGSRATPVLRALRALEAVQVRRARPVLRVRGAPGVPAARGRRTRCRLHRLLGLRRAHHATLTDTLTASCPNGTIMLSGDATTATTDSQRKVQITDSYPSASDTWSVSGAAKLGANKTSNLQVWAFCRALS